MITSSDGDLINNTEIYRIVTNLYPSRVSDINLTMKWIKSLMKENARKFNSSRLKKII